MPAHFVTLPEGRKVQAAQIVTGTQGPLLDRDADIPARRWLGPLLTLSGQMPSLQKKGWRRHCRFRPLACGPVSAVLYIGQQLA